VKKPPTELKGGDVGFVHLINGHGPGAKKDTGRPGFRNWKVDEIG